MNSFNPGYPVTLLELGEVEVNHLTHLFRDGIGGGLAVGLASGFGEGFGAGEIDAADRKTWIDRIIAFQRNRRGNVFHREIIESESRMMI